MTTEARRSDRSGVLARMSQRLVAQNRAYGDAWARYAHPTTRHR